MSKTTKSILAVLSVALVYMGIYYSTDLDSDASSFLKIPDIATESAGEYAVDTVASSDEPASVGAQSGENPAVSNSILQQFNDEIVGIAEMTNPTVVTIQTRQTVRFRQRHPFSFFFDDPRFDQEREYQRQGLGSGVIVSGDGYIITNNHVIDEADEILVQTYEEEELEAEIVGTDPESDVAVLKVNSSGLPAITMGDSDALRVGEMVLAIGSPLNPEFAHTVSKGVVSATGRANLGLSAFENYIQTDAAINPGNSGGALINMNGELIGINTAIASRTGGHQGIGFAIPSNMVRMIMNSIIEEGRVVRSHLGIQRGAMVDRVMARALNLDVNYGIVIGEVIPDSPAEKAGLAEGDVLLRKNGQPIRDWAQFRLAIANAAPGTEVEFEIFRDGERMTRTVVLEERPEDEPLAALPENEQEELREELGFAVSDLTDNIRRQLNISGNVEGVVVREIRQGGRAYRQGLRRGDVITQVQNQLVTSESEFYSTVAGLMTAGQEVMLMRVTRQEQNLFIALEL